jgi:DNA (cytosine-5)-methyltransferase 1
MDIPWTENRKSIAEAIPPAYARFIGGQMIGRLNSQAYVRELAA